MLCRKSSWYFAYSLNVYLIIVSKRITEELKAMYDADVLVSFCSLAGALHKVKKRGRLSVRIVSELVKQMSG